MRIDLKDETEIFDWNSFFRLFEKSKYEPIWVTIDIPEKIISSPLQLIVISSSFVKRESILINSNPPYKQDLASYQESLRLIHLGFLNRAFGEIVFNYGENDAINMYELADRIFLREKGMFWLDWWELFSAEIEIEKNLDKYLVNSNTKSLREIVDSKLSFFENRQLIVTRLLSEIGQDDEFVSNLFEEIVQKECSFQIWKSINRLFEKETKEKIYKWGSDNIELAGTETIWFKMKTYCFSV